MLVDGWQCTYCVSRQDTSIFSFSHGSASLCIAIASIPSIPSTGGGAGALDFVDGVNPAGLDLALHGARILFMVNICWGTSMIPNTSADDHLLNDPTDPVLTIAIKATVLMVCLRSGTILPDIILI